MKGLFNKFIVPIIYIYIHFMSPVLSTTWANIFTCDEQHIVALAQKKSSVLKHNPLFLSQLKEKRKDERRWQNF